MIKELECKLYEKRLRKQAYFGSEESTFKVKHDSNFLISERRVQRREREKNLL